MAKRETSGAAAIDLGYVARTLAVGLASGVFLGFVGPFGTFASMSLERRLPYWIAMIMGGTLFVPVLYQVARAVAADRVGAWMLVPLVAIVGAVPVTLMVIAITTVMLNIPIRFTVELYLLVLGITVPLVIINHFLVRYRESREAIRPVTTASAPAATPVQPGAKPRPRLLDRLPGKLGDEIICLQMEDHYVRVHTRLGQELILMRMADAVAELDGVEGLRVHRSWWVARAAVAAVQREGKAVSLHLENGLTAPVARDRIAEVRAAGWLARD